ncbi:sulfatase [Lentisphaera marina]|uniref:sulfatase family protein n=1 Tax=Lentisphaera marina TaxID=1111041 RepID=UPI0023654E9B|nr:sulfatase [Lentisphaera marina]MDD7984636.1 sulfatase [Lentisphaera marina]
MRLYIFLFLVFINILHSTERVNFLFITADDMNWNSVGCFGSEIKETTPHIDQLAKEGMRFANAHVATTVCMPSRNAINSGRLPHRSGGEGFHHFTIPNVPTIPSVLSKNGYKVGILGKVGHSTPYKNTHWDHAEEVGRNTEVITQKAAKFADSAIQENKAFYLIVNSHDPHRPYYNWKNEGKEQRSHKGKAPNSHPSKVFKPQDMIIPAFLPDTKEIRHELANYYCSVRRCDDLVGRLMDMVQEKRLQENTMIVFLSDHGMGAPSAKANAYVNSTKTPMIIKYPPLIKAGSVHKEFSSVLDLFPTMLDLAGIESPGGFDGQSLKSVFNGGKLKDRDELFFTYFYAKNGNGHYNMRTALDHKYSYTFNSFYTGKRLYATSSLGGNFFTSMVQQGKTDPHWNKRAEFILRRAPEELYDLEKDPYGFNNLANNPEYREVMDKFRKAMEANMEKTNDFVSPVFNTYQETKDPKKMRVAYEKVQASGVFVGNIPKREKDMSKWSKP